MRLVEEYMKAQKMTSAVAVIKKGLTAAYPEKLCVVMSHIHTSRSQQ
jgi:hypothetical protein